MRIKLTSWFGILLFISFSISAKPVLNIQHWITTNGARVLFVRTHELPMLDIQVSFNAGAARDNKQFGLAQFTNAMLAEGTKSLTADQIAASFDKVGAILQTYVDKDMAIVSLRSLIEPKLLNPALDTFSRILISPAFPAVAFKRVQQQMLNAITKQQQQPLTIAGNVFWQTLYGDSPYGHPVLGTTKTIRMLTSKNLQVFYREYYVAKNATVAIVGDITLSQANKIVKHIIGELPPGKAASKLSSVSALTDATNKQIKFPAAQTNIVMGQIGIARDDTDYFPLLVGNYILGKSPLTSELFQEVRNKHGLAYSVASSFVPLQAPGPFSLVLQTRTEKAEQAIRVARQTLTRFVRQGPTREQLDSAKQSLVGGFPLHLASNSKILASLSLIGFYHLPLDYLDSYRSKILSVTLEQVQAAFKRHINLNKMIMVRVG